jgi:hypothetical protein
MVAVCVYHIVKVSFWGDLRLVLFVYIAMLKVTFGETFVGCCLYRSKF